MSKSAIHKFSAILVSSCLIACGGGGGGGSDSESMRIRFVPRIAGQAFACGQTYEGLGNPPTNATPKDLRFYVSDVELITSDGQSVPLALTDDGKWQDRGLALLDFEDGTGGCDEGNADLNDSLVGVAESGDYRGLRFTVGVPFDRNHIDAQVAPPPQNVTGLWWNWNFGHIFFKYDLVTAGMPDGFRTHVGSTGCEGNEAGPAVECMSPNRIRVTLSDFTPGQDSVAIELAQLHGASDLNQNTPQTAPGCMSSQDDPECPAIFPRLGLPIGSIPDGEQQIFYTE